MKEQQILEAAWKDFDNKYPLTSHRRSFNAGYSLSQQVLAEKEKEIERLKGLIANLWWKKLEIKHYGLHHPETNETLWQQFKSENKI